MSIVPASRSYGKALFEGVSGYLPHDDRSDNKGPGGAYSHLAIEWAATEAESWADAMRFYNEILGAGIVGLPIETIGASYALGTILTVTGYNPVSSKFTVTKANAADPTKPPQLVVNQAIGFSSTGWAYTSPLVEGIDTSTAVSAGTLAYLGTSGAFQFSAPSGAGDHAFKVGACTIKHAGSGAVQFFPPAPTNLASGSSGGGAVPQSIYPACSNWGAAGSGFAIVYLNDQNGSAYSGSTPIYGDAWFTDEQYGQDTVTAGYDSMTVDQGKFVAAINPAKHWTWVSSGASAQFTWILLGWSGTGISHVMNCAVAGQTATTFDQPYGSGWITYTP